MRNQVASSVFWHKSELRSLANLMRARYENEFYNAKDGVRHFLNVKIYETVILARCVLCVYSSKYTCRNAFHFANDFEFYESKYLRREWECRQRLQWEIARRLTRDFDGRSPHRIYWTVSWFIFVLLSDVFVALELDAPRDRCLYFSLLLSFWT